MNKITFTPKNIETDCASNENVFKASKRIGLDISSTCNGTGVCGLCRITIVSGEENLNKLTKAETIHLGNVYFINKKRLACQVKFCQDGEVVVKIDE